MTTLRLIPIVTITFFMTICLGCKKETSQSVEPKMGLTIDTILGNPNYLAMSYGGYREESRDIQPTIEQLKEDILILSAMGVKIIRTYNVHLPQAENILKAITILRSEQPDFEMYVMLGAWIDCENAWQEGKENHEGESDRNPVEIAQAVKLTNLYPDIVKVIAVGNEAMVHWAASYFVRPKVILKWVNHLQELKASGGLPSDLWITSSDNYASWGGGDEIYHTEDLNELIYAVDFLSVHTYPMHETHYNYEFWLVRPEEKDLSKEEKINAAMERALNEAKIQYNAVQDYMTSIGADKPIHIGETGWATISDEFYGNEGSRACDEYKQGIYYRLLREWTNENHISCFFFEGFDEKWKDEKHPNGSENHFGLINLDGKAKYAIWDLVDKGTFEGLTRGGNTITKSKDGDEAQIIAESMTPPIEYDNGL